MQVVVENDGTSCSMLISPELDVPFLLAIDSVVASIGVAVVSTIVSTVVSKTISTVVSVPGVSFSLSLSFRGSFRGSLGLSRPLAIDSVVGVAIVSTVVSAVVSKTMSPVVSMTVSTVVSIPRISFSLGLSFRGSFSFSRPLAIDSVGRVAIIASIMMSKAVVASIKKVRISLWIGNCLCLSFRLPHGEDGQAEKSQNPDHPADAEVGWKCDEFLTGCSF